MSGSCKIVMKTKACPECEPIYDNRTRIFLESDGGISNKWTVYY
jgi:hypothetical protein